MTTASDWISLPFAVLGLFVALPAIADGWAFLRPRRLAKRVLPRSDQSPSLLLLVPAHDEELLIGRTVDSLRSIDYPPEQFQVTVVADNCRDRTAELARDHGAVVLERRSESERGKHAAIGWALERLPLERFAALVILDADTIVEPGFARAIADQAPLEEKALQTYDGMSNEFENRLTRMAGVLTRNRYGIVLPLKESAGLNTPLTGDGTVLGTALLRRHPWRIRTVTEGWELYAQLTLAGERIGYLPDARLYAQETRSLRQSRTQRERWTSGRLAVFRIYWRRILTARTLSWLERLDLVAELTNLGPVMRAALGLAGGAAVVLLHPPGAVPLGLLLATGVLQPALYSALSLRRHPEPAATVRAFLFFPFYALWRVAVGARAFAMSGRRQWTRTARHEETDGTRGDS